jgi:hypothetical protein
LTDRDIVELAEAIGKIVEKIMILVLDKTSASETKSDN